MPIYVDIHLTLEEAIRLHTASGRGSPDEVDEVLETARDELLAGSTLAWQQYPEEAARVEESLRLFERLKNGD